MAPLSKIQEENWEFIDGTLPIPKKEDPNYKAWHRCNIMVVNWITRSLSPQLAQSTIYLDNAKKLWDELKERFTKGDYFRISDLIQEIHSIKQGDKSVTEFFTEFKILWDELEMLSPTPECTCVVKCSCDLVKSIQKKQEIEQVVCFLKGLGEVYSTVKSNILMMEPLPSINKAYGLVLQQEGQLQGATTPESKILNTASTQPNPTIKVIGDKGTMQVEEMGEVVALMLLAGA